MVDPLFFARGSGFPGRRPIAAVVTVLVVAGLMTITGPIPSADAAFPPAVADELRDRAVPESEHHGPGPDATAAARASIGTTRRRSSRTSGPDGGLRPGVDPTTISGKLDDDSTSSRRTRAGSCSTRATSARPTAAGMSSTSPPRPARPSSLHPLRGWRRLPVAGDDLGLLSADRRFDQGPRSRWSSSTTTAPEVAERSSPSSRWNGTTWAESPIVPTSAFNSSVSSAQSPAFGEFAVDLTAAGILPSTPSDVPVVRLAVRLHADRELGAGGSSRTSSPSLRWRSRTARKVQITKVDEPVGPAPACDVPLRPRAGRRSSPSKTRTPATPAERGLRIRRSRSSAVRSDRSWVAHR